jgi:gamma-glutamylcyclotransferase (GGCT)/AIG2-like uncharacterized protein YtfP
MPSSTTGDLLFVYGTLRKNSEQELNSMMARDSTFVGDGKIHGELYDLGTYPGAFVEGGCSDMVMGEVYALNSDGGSRKWQELDHYEGCGPHDPEPHEYRRQKVHVFLNDGTEVDASAYVLTRLPATAVRIPDGDYLTWRRQKSD